MEKWIKNLRKNLREIYEKFKEIYKQKNNKLKNSSYIRHIFKQLLQRGVIRSIGNRLIK